MVKQEGPLEFVNLEMGVYVLYRIYHYHSHCHALGCVEAQTIVSTRWSFLCDSESVTYTSFPPLSVFCYNRYAGWWGRTALRRSNVHGRRLHCRAVDFTQHGCSLLRVPCCLIGTTQRLPCTPINPSNRYYTSFHPVQSWYDENNRICWDPLQTRNGTT